MTDYIDYVVCKHDDKPYLFVAPAWSYLEPGDRVIVETKRGTSNATVIASHTDVNTMDSDVVKLFVAASGANWPLKRVVGRVRNVDWSDYDSKESGETASGEPESTEETTEHTEV